MSSKKYPADKSKARELLKGVGDRLGFQVTDYATDDTVAKHARAVDAMQRAKSVVKAMHGPKPRAEELAAMGTLIAMICPDEFSTVSQWTAFSSDLGVKDVRKIKCVIVYILF